MHEKDIEMLLKVKCFGKENAKSSRIIEQALRINGTELRKKIHKLRCHGVPIASCECGYYYAKNAAEIFATIRQLEKMRNGLDDAIEGLVDSMFKFDGQAGGMR